MAVFKSFLPFHTSLDMPMASVLLRKIVLGLSRILTQAEHFKYPAGEGLAKQCPQQS